MNDSFAGRLDCGMKFIGAGFLRSLFVGAADNEINRQTKHVAVGLDRSSDMGSIPITSIIVNKKTFHANNCVEGFFYYLQMISAPWVPRKN